MSTWTLLVVSTLYFMTGIQQAMVGSPWWFGFWTSYAVANICWIMAAK